MSGSLTITGSNSAVADICRRITEADIDVAVHLQTEAKDDLRSVSDVASSVAVFVSSAGAVAALATCFVEHLRAHRVDIEVRRGDETIILKGHRSDLDDVVAQLQRLLDGSSLDKEPETPPLDG